MANSLSLVTPAPAGVYDSAGTPEEPYAMGALLVFVDEAVFCRHPQVVAR